MCVLECLKQVQKEIAPPFITHCLSLLQLAHAFDNETEIIV